MQVNLKSKWLELLLATVLVICKVDAVLAAEAMLQPKISGFFLGEYIYSNYNQALPSGNRFEQVKAFDILCFPRASLNMQANSNENAAVNVFMGFNFRSSCCYGNKNDSWSFSKFGNTDHAYIKIKNDRFMRSEVLFGIQYLPYGNYEHNKIPATFTQLLTETQAGSLVLNALLDDFTISGFVFNGKNASNKATSINNFGMQVKYASADCVLKAGYLYNIANTVDYIVYGYPQNVVSPQAPNPLSSTYAQRVAGIAASALIYLLPDYRAEFGFTAALNKFKDSDLNWNQVGAKPGATLVRFGKKFMLFGYKNDLSVNYQYSWQALNVRGPNLLRGLPKQRYQLDWVIEPLKDVELGAHYIVDLAYQSNLTSSNTFIVTISYLFELLS